MNLSLLIIALVVLLGPCHEAQAYMRKHHETLFVEKEFSPSESWIISKHDDDNIRFLLSTLEKTEAGRFVMQRASDRASERGETLFDLIKPGGHSMTDTTLIRRFPADRPDRILYEEHSKIFINSDLPMLDAVLDLAHELTHFSFRMNFNPYELNFSIEKFIKATVEGRGGEVDAFMMECRVLRELSPRTIDKKYQCNQIMDPRTQRLSRARAIDQFYKVGKQFNSFKDQLRTKQIDPSHLPQLSEDDPIFISSVYGLPYPVAAFQEYISVMERVCENDRRRLSYMKDNLQRSPASQITDRPSFQTYQTLSKSFQSRCELKADSR